MKVRIIRAQCGKMIVNVDKLENMGITRHIGFEDGKEYECFNVTAHKVANLGKYSTVARAIRTLDMLTEWLTIPKNKRRNAYRLYEQAELGGSDLVCDLQDAIEKNSYFQMPQDGEELDT